MIWFLTIPRWFTPGTIKEKSRNHSVSPQKSSQANLDEIMILRLYLVSDIDYIEWKLRGWIREIPQHSN